MDPKEMESNQYLTFTLAGETFAMNIASVREILDEKDITAIPRTPEYMRGVINVRGKAVPVVDLRTRFGMGKSEIGVETCIIITEIGEDSEAGVIGALADSVQEVVEIAEEAIAPPPRMGTAVDTDFIRGMGQKDEQFIIILDIGRVFTTGELETVHDLTLAA